MTRNRYYDGPPSDHFDGTRFFNPGHPATDRSLGDLLRWRLAGRRERWQRRPGAQIVPRATVDSLAVTAIGHASLLIQVAGYNLVVDPVWAQRVGPWRWAGPRRVSPPRHRLRRFAGHRQFVADP